MVVMWVMHSFHTLMIQLFAKTFSHFDMFAVQTNNNNILLRILIQRERENTNVFIFFARQKKQKKIEICAFTIEPNEFVSNSGKCLLFFHNEMFIIGYFPSVSWSQTLHTRIAFPLFLTFLVSFE